MKYALATLLILTSLTLNAQIYNSIENSTRFGEWNEGIPGDTVQVLLSGKHNTGANNGSTDGTYKLKIEGYNNDGGIVYPIYVMDENEKVDFYLKNRPNQGGIPTMYFGGDVYMGDTDDSNTRIEWRNNPGALMAGKATGTQWDTVGIYSFIAGLNNKVKGQYSASFGENNEVSGVHSFAIGLENKVTGPTSGSFGKDNEVTSGGAFAIGLGNKVTGEASASFGQYNEVSGSLSFAIGSDNKVTGQSSASFGQNNEVSGLHSFAIGGSNKVTGQSSASFGENNEVTGNTAFAIGLENKVTGLSSAVFGLRNKVTSRSTVAFGEENQASGYASAVLGFSNKVEGSYALAGGTQLRVKSYSEMAVGRYNDTLTTNTPTSWNADEILFATGNGTSHTDRNNAFTIMKNGEAHFHKQDENEHAILIAHRDGPKYGGASVFNFNSAPGQSTGFVLEHRAQTDSLESSGVYGDGNQLHLWSPGDGGRLLAVHDEDDMTINASERWYIDGSGNPSSLVEENPQFSPQQLNDAIQKVKTLRSLSYIRAQEVKDGQVVNKSAKQLHIDPKSLKKILPELVDTKENGQQYIKYHGVIVLLTEAVKEQQMSIDHLRVENREWKIKNDALNARLERIEVLLQNVQEENRG